MGVGYRVEYFPATPSPLVSATSRGRAAPGYFVRLRRLEDNEILLSSEAYTRKWSAKRAASRIGAAFNVPVVELDAHSKEVS